MTAIITGSRMKKRPGTPAETAARTVRIPERAETVQEMGMAQEAGTALSLIHI